MSFARARACTTSRDALMASEPFFCTCLPREHVRVLTRYTPTSGHSLQRDDAAAAASLRIFRLTWIFKKKKVDICLLRFYFFSVLFHIFFPIGTYLY